MNEKTLSVPFFWDGVRRGIFAMALAVGCKIVQGEATPSTDFMMLVTGACVLVFGLSITARPWFGSRLCLGLAVGGMTMSLMHVFGHDGQGFLPGISMSGLGAIFLGLAASTMMPLRPSRARVVMGRMTQGETVAAQW